MLKYIYALAFSFILFGIAMANPTAGQAFTGCDYRYSNLEYVAGVMFVKSSNIAANGVACAYYSGRKRETPYKNGVIEGIEKYYYNSGALKSATSYKNGKKNGIAQEYSKSNVLEYEVSYIDNEKDGVEREYYESGALHYETPYKNGEKDGIKKTYYKSGELSLETIYENGDMGIIRSYNENGELIYESTPFDRMMDDFADAMKTLGFITIVPTTAPTFSSTYTTYGDLMFAELSNTEIFVLENMDSLIRDIATGKGETIDALAVLIDIADDKASFGARLQANFEIIFPNADFDYRHVVYAIEMLS